MSDCIFCKIVKKEIPSKIIFENDFALAFKDINPQAPVHLLIVPKVHYSTLEDITDENMLGKLIVLARELAKEFKLVNGYRLVINKGDDGGQTVYHLHVHILGGRQMMWPPG